ncbi:MAG TPA: SET domain-containing protein-lysine N-methyltransferase [Stellaceae bacterium]
MPIPNFRLEIREHPVRGRGIFALEPIGGASLIEAAPVIILPARECAMLDRTVLHDYYFHWDGDPDGVGRGAVALGLVTLCNHSARPRARVIRNFERRTLDLVAIDPIGAGEEVTIDYNCPLWFEPSE